MTKKISELTQLTEPASGDQLPLVDVSDVSQAPSGTTKHIEVGDFLQNVPVAPNIKSADGIDISPGSDVDADLITVGVTGSPKAKWDEANDRFDFNKGINVSSGDLRVGGLPVSGSAATGRNLLINGSLEVWQRGTLIDAASDFTNNNDSYIADRWILLSDGNDIVDVSKESMSSPSLTLSHLRATVQTPNRKFGFVQILEQRDSWPLQGKGVSLSIHAKTTAAAIRNIRAAVLSWTGTADAPTSDVVSAWNVEGSNPTFAANWTAENTAADLALTSSWQTFTIENISVDTANLNNLAVFIWVDDTDAAASDVLDIAWVKLELNASATDFEPANYADEFRVCQRYFQRLSSGGLLGLKRNAGNFFFVTFVSTPMRIDAPTLTAHDDGILADYDSTLDATLTDFALSSPKCTEGFFSYEGVADSAPKGHVAHQGFDFSFDAEL